MHTYARTHMHAHIHTHTHMHTYMHTSLVRSSPAEDPSRMQAFGLHLSRGCGSNPETMRMRRRLGSPLGTPHTRLSRSDSTHKVQILLRVARAVSQAAHHEQSKPASHNHSKPHHRFLSVSDLGKCKVLLTGIVRGHPCRLHIPVGSHSLVSNFSGCAGPEAFDSISFFGSPFVFREHHLRGL